MNSEKVTSKYYRIRMSDAIRKLIGALPFEALEETQVGNHIYSGTGRIRMGDKDVPAMLRIRLIDGVPTVFMRAPTALLYVTCSFAGAERVLPEAVRLAARLLVS